MRSIPALFAVAIAAVAVAVSSAPVSEADARAATARPTLRVVTKTFTPRIPASDEDSIQGFFASSQYMSHSCARGETSIAPGIVNATHYTAAQSFGPSVVSGFATGPSGRATMRLQLLCARNVRVTSMRVPGRTVPGVGTSIGGQASGRTTAIATCPRGRIALGSPLSQEFSPAFGSFSSVPFGARGWKVVVQDVPAQLTANRTVPAYAAVTCVPATVFTSILKVKKSVQLGATGSASTTVTCARGRRPLAFGVELEAFSSRMPRDGAWNTPIVQRAQFLSAGVKFTFRMPAGASVSDGATTKQTGHVVCGKLRA